MAANSDNQPVPLWIDNKPHTSEIVFPVINYGHGRTTSAYGATPDIARDAIRSCQTAFESWRHTTPWERRELLLKAAKILAERADVVKEILETETSVDDFMVYELNIKGSVDQLQELASHVLQTTEGTVQQSKLDKHSLLMTMREPIGVNLAIAPWNASILLAMRAVATPIACGNTVVLKASEMSPLAHHFLGTLFRDAEFPAGVLNIIQHKREDAEFVTDALISDDRVRKVNFTGSTAVGRIIASKAAQHGKPVLLELGGKCPQIVLADADLEKAAQAAAFGAFAHHGQICMSTERIIVAQEVMEEFATKLQAILPSVKMHPGASETNASKVAALVSDAVSQGATLLSGDSLQIQGSLITPQVLNNVTRDMEIWRTETFGPITVLVGFASVKEAISMANDSEYGLSASIFTANTARAINIAKSLEVGAVHINSTTVHDEAHMAHGGTKASGWGRFGSPWGLFEFTQLKTITIPIHGEADAWS